MEVEDYPELHNKFLAGLGYMRPCLKETKTKTKLEKHKSFSCHPLFLIFLCPSLLDFYPVFLEWVVG